MFMFGAEVKDRQPCLLVHCKVWRDAFLFSFVFYHFFVSVYMYVHVFNAVKNASYSNVMQKFEPISIHKFSLRNEKLTMFNVRSIPSSILNRIFIMRGCTNNHNYAYTEEKKKKGERKLNRLVSSSFVVLNLNHIK